MTKNIKSFITKEKPFNALLGIQRNEDANITSLHDDIGTTYAHACNIVSELSEMNLVKREKEGRTKKLFLTGSGRELVDKLEKLDNVFSEVENNET